MSQDKDTSPSASVNWREPTTEDKSKAGFWRPGKKLVSVCELGDVGVADAAFAVCLYLRRGKFNAAWWESYSYDDEYPSALDSGWVPMMDLRHTVKSIALKLGYALERTSWDSLEEAQSALTHAIENGRVLAIQLEREEQIVSERQAKAEAEEKALFAAAGDALFAARAAQMRDQEADERARYAAAEAVVRSHEQEHRTKHDNSKGHDILTTIMLWAWFGFPIWFAVYAVVVRRSCAGTSFVAGLLILVGGVSLAVTVGKLLSFLTSGANPKAMEPWGIGVLWAIIRGVTLAVGMTLTALVLNAFCEQL